VDKKEINKTIVIGVLEKMAEYGIDKKALPVICDLVMIKDDALRKLSGVDKNDK